MAYTKKAERKKEFAEIGARLAAKHGAKNVTRRMVAEKAKVPESLVSHHVGGTEVAQKLYAATAKKLGLALPDKAEVERQAALLRKKSNEKKQATKAANAAKPLARDKKGGLTTKKSLAKSAATRATARSAGDAKKSSRTGARAAANTSTQATRGVAQRKAKREPASSERKTAARRLPAPPQAADAVKAKRAPLPPPPAPAALPLPGDQRSLPLPGDDA